MYSSIWDKYNPQSKLNEPSYSDENVDLKVEETRFRPNILIEGDFPPFSEDQWPHIKIGAVVFRNVRVCDRYLPGVGMVVTLVF